MVVNELPERKTERRKAQTNIKDLLLEDKSKESKDCNHGVDNVPRVVAGGSLTSSDRVENDNRCGGKRHDLAHLL